MLADTHTHGIENFEINSDNSVEPLLMEHFRALMQSHPADTRQSLKLGEEQRLKVTVSDNFPKLQMSSTTDSCHIEVPRAEAQTTLVRSEGFQWGNGMMALPTFFAFLEQGFFGTEDSPLTADAFVSVREMGEKLCQQVDRHLGVLVGGLRLLNLVGWVQLRGLNEQATFALTLRGEVALHAMRRHQHELKPIFSGLERAAKYYETLRATGSTKSGAISFLSWVEERSRNGWDLIETPTSQNALRVNNALNNYLDGVCMGPVLVALSMPKYTDLGDKLVAAAPSILSQLETGNTLDLCGIPQVNIAFLRVAFKLLANRGLATVVEDSPRRFLVHLNEKGILHARYTPPFLALTCSYYPSYQNIEEIFFRNPDPLDIASDRHVDRVMNIYGSSGAGSGPATQVICEQILKPLFDDTPLDEQPAGIADMGCGDATALEQMARWVIQHTKRGQHLKSHPLVVIGADYNEASRSRARDTLASLNRHSGVETHVVFANVTDPDEYDNVVRNLGLSTRSTHGNPRPLGIGDLVHTFMFLIHNRQLVVNCDTEARNILGEAVRSTPVENLEKVISAAHGTTIALPTDPTERASFVSNQFATAYSERGPLAPGYRVGADFVQFMQRWAPYTTYGMVAVESHCPWSSKLVEPTPADSTAWLRAERLPIALTWGMHFVSAQFLMPYEEYTLAMALAGFKPVDDKIHGGLFPEAIPAIDRSNAYRWFSIGCYRSER